MSDETPPITEGHYRIGRFYCDQCNRVGAVVRPADCDEVRCPRCGSLCAPAGGADDLR